jgi:membrane-associated phospholipid phosphatase
MVLKVTLLAVFGAVFFACYFLLLNFPVFPVTEMPFTWFDHLVQFQPMALVLYISLWIYVSLAPGLLDDRRELLAYYRAMTGLALVGLAFFFFWPTCVPRLDLNWANHPAFLNLKTVDGSGNAFPSLHVTFAIFTAIWLDRLLRHMGGQGRLRALSWCWCAGILYSTLATKQHVALDVIAGTALGMIGAAIPVQYPKRLPLVIAIAEVVKPVPTG